jgi:hypothetical protein
MLLADMGATGPGPMPAISTILTPFSGPNSVSPVG